MPVQGHALLKAEDIGAFLQLHTKSIYKLAAAGKIPSVRVGKTVRFDLPDVMAALKNGNGKHVPTHSDSPAGVEA